MGFSSSSIRGNGEVDQVCDFFGLAKGGSIAKVEKANALSSLYFYTNSQGRYVLRVQDDEDRLRLENQCHLFAQGIYPYLLQPLTGASGTYTCACAGRLWIAYPYIEGDIFLTEEANLLPGVFGSLDYLNSLKQQASDFQAIVPSLYQVDRNLEALDGLENKLLSGRYDAFLPDELKAYCLDHKDILSRMVELAKQAEIGAKGITHGDLQHANLVMNGQKTYVIDVEDMCIDSYAVSSAHAIFKLVRHAVYLGLCSLEHLRKTYVGPIVNYAFEQGLQPAKSRQTVQQFAALRTLHDIRMIMGFLEHEETQWMSYDFEKKIQNIFEINEIFKAEGA